MTSPPAWWCGLKSYAHIQFRHCRVVTTCVVVWIEITIFLPSSVLSMVTTCVVVWIEMYPGAYHEGYINVTTCVVVWIEMLS